MSKYNNDPEFVRKYNLLLRKAKGLRNKLVPAAKKLFKEYKELEEENERLKKKITEYEAENEVERESKEQVEELEKENQKLRAQVKELRKLESPNKRLRKENEELKEEIEKLRDQVEELLAENEALSDIKKRVVAGEFQTPKSLKSLNKRLERRAGESASELAEVKQQNEKLYAENVQLNSEVKELKEIHDAFGATVKKERQRFHEKTLSFYRNRRRTESDCIAIHGENLARQQLANGLSLCCVPFTQGDTS